MALDASPEVLPGQLFLKEWRAFWLDSSLLSPQRRFSFMGASGETVE
jgi:hypothetical protein